jgi:hypothetical protein
MVRQNQKKIEMNQKPLVQLLAQDTSRSHLGIPADGSSIYIQRKTLEQKRLAAL